jgi:hypothetical protein
MESVIRVYYGHVSMLGLVARSPLGMVLTQEPYGTGVEAPPEPGEGVDAPVA